MPARLTYGFYSYFVRVLAAAAAPIITVTLFTGASSL